MQDPTKDITPIVKALIEAPTANDQASTLRRYFSPDASFDHPLCSISSNPNSRDQGLLKVYQWLRMMFTPTIVVSSVAFDQERSRLYVDAAQTLQPNIPPVSWLYAPTCRLIVVLHLHKGGDGLFYIHRQEDFYSYQVMPGQLLPGGYTIITTIKFFTGIGCILLAYFTALFTGYWKVTGEGTAGKIRGGKGSKGSAVQQGQVPAGGRKRLNGNKSTWEGGDIIQQ